MEIALVGQIDHFNKITANEYNVAQINSITSKHKELRSKSKAPTFALT